jgi:hypothetical protein
VVVLVLEAVVWAVDFVESVGAEVDTGAVDGALLTGAPVVGAATMGGAADVVGAGGGAGAFTGLVSVSPWMIGDVGSGSIGVPASTESMKAFQMCPGSPAP